MKTIALIFCVLSVNYLYSQHVKIDLASSPISIILKNKPQPEQDIFLAFNSKLPNDLMLTLKFLGKNQSVIKRIEISNKSQSYSSDTLRLTIPPPDSSTYTLMIKKNIIDKIEVSFKKAGDPINVKLNEATVKTFELVLNEAITGSSIHKASQECVIQDKSLHYFIPPIFAAPLRENYVSCLNDYKVVYDLTQDDPRICYYKKVKCKYADDTVKHKIEEDCACKNSAVYCYQPVQKLRPAVGKNVGFHIFGYYPHFDSLAVGFGFESRNLEDREAFAAAFGQGAATEEDKPDGEAADTVAKAASSKEKDPIKSLKNDEVFFSKMREEFGEYYLHLITQSPNSELVQIDIKYINQMLNQYCLTLDQFSSAGLLAATEKYLASYAETGEKATATKDLKAQVFRLAAQAARYYGFILHYNSMKIPVVQIENEDQFRWTVDFYKNKTKAHSQKYTAMIKGGWKIDFSTGFVFNKLIDNKYSIKYDTVDISPNEVVDPVAAGKIIRQDEGKYVVDVGIISHIYPRTGSRVNVGLNTGIVIRNGSNVKYLLGGSLMFGYEQRFILSGGWVGGTTQVLDETYNDALDSFVSRNRLTTISSSIPTTNRWNWNGYFAITYNLGGANVGGKKN
jgi:hypothetical protein